jgi:hypothetical protein
MGEIIGLVAVICVFSTPVIAILANHRQKIAEIKARGQSADSGLANEIRELKKQVEEMRDTTSRYDMSFDTALQRIESRVANVETRVKGLESEPLAQGRSS